jgi:hypothetical protein
MRLEKKPGHLNFFKNRDHKTQFINELTEIIDSSNFILISSVIDKRLLKKEYSNPYHIALNFCLETLYDFLQEKDQVDFKTHIVFESRGKKEDRDLELEFRRVCDQKPDLNTKLPFEILFSDKKAMSSGLQLADLVARPIGLNVLRTHQNNRAFNVLKQKFYCEGGRKNIGNGYEGYGLKIYPDIKSEKPR